jgi:integrase
MCAFTFQAMNPTVGCSPAMTVIRYTRTRPITYGARLVKAGVTFNLHDLRHFYASGLIAAGCDVVTVQRALGHGKASLTLNTYSHLWPRAEDRTRNAAAQMLNEALTADRVRTQQQ